MGEKPTSARAFIKALPSSSPPSSLILDAAHDLNLSATLTVRVHPDSGRGLMRKGMESLFTDRNGWPRFCGAVSLVKGYMHNGDVPQEIARRRIGVGCHWMAVPGLEYPMQGQVKST